MGNKMVGVDWRHFNFYLLLGNLPHQKRLLPHCFSYFMSTHGIKSVFTLFPLDFSDTFPPQFSLYMPPSFLFFFVTSPYAPKKINKIHKNNFVNGFDWGTNYEKLRSSQLEGGEEKKKYLTSQLSRDLTRLSKRPYQGRGGVSLSYFRFLVKILEKQSGDFNVNVNYLCKI